MDRSELRQIPHLPNHYASADGNIWKKLKGVPRYQKERKAVHRLHEGCWYFFFKPSIKGKKKNYLGLHIKSSEASLSNTTVHRLVLLTFQPRDGSELLQVNHIDRNTFNNKVDNLEWVTPKENVHHYLATSLPDSYEQLRQDYLDKLSLFCQDSDLHSPMKIGSWQIKYDIDLILYELAHNPGSIDEIAKKINVSRRAVRYWQEKCKIKRPKPPKLLDQVNRLLSEKENYTPNQLAEITGARVTSIHAVLRKRMAS